MRKIPSLFIRDWNGDRSRVTREVNPEAAWVVAGEGIATRKFDGTAVMFRAGKMYARFDCKKSRTPPSGFEACQEPDPETGHWPGWVPVEDQPQYKWYRTAHQQLILQMKSELGHSEIPDGTYELCGPHFQGNPEGLDRDFFFHHGDLLLSDLSAMTFVPRYYDGLASWLKENAFEGIVWHNPDGRMAKIKRTDFGLPWPIQSRK